ncbi:CBS domain-containing protein [Candidatus Woesearchaeota archaeon]|nr:CBS domain-containing protein [Candidatus Woesearchaeota archaeon]
MTFDIKQLRAIRKRLDLTQHAFAKEADVSQSLVAKMEAGRLDPSYSIVCRLEEAVNRLLATGEPNAAALMTKKVIAVQHNDPLSKVIDTLQQHEISQVPVLRNSSVIGLITEADIIEHRAKARALEAADVMGPAPPLVAETTSLSVLTALLRQYPLIIVVKNGEPAGVVTKADVLRSLVG